MGGDAGRQACAGGGCQLLLYRVDAQTGARIGCQEYASVCADWWTETVQATQNTDRYECQYNGAPIALDECKVYAQAFKTGQYADPRTGESPAPETPTQPQDESCPPPFTWTSLVNPWWYYKGFTCGLSWAFEPKVTPAAVGQLVTTAQGKAPIPEIRSVITCFPRRRTPRLNA